MQNGKIDIFVILLNGFNKSLSYQMAALAALNYNQLLVSMFYVVNSGADPNQQVLVSGIAPHWSLQFLNHQISFNGAEVQLLSMGKANHSAVISILRTVL